jgi:hypothetical protein
VYEVFTSIHTDTPFYLFSLQSLLYLRIDNDFITTEFKKDESQGNKCDTGNIHVVIITTEYKKTRVRGTKVTLEL